MSASIVNGWVTVTYTGHDLSQVYISVGDMNNWAPAFLDYENGKRIAKVRVPDPTGKPLQVFMKVNGSVASAGRVIH